MKTETVVENGFKETEIGLIPEDWKVKGFEECIDKERISRDIKIPQGKYKKVGRYPIVDQGASFVAGYTDDKSKLYSGCLPVIVFGDHTRIFKFVDFSFSLGADGTKLIQPKDFLNPKYFYYYLCSLIIESKGYNRHYKYLKEKFIAFPEKPEQQKIAFVLSKIQQAIEQQDRIIETTKELKKSLMNKLFAEGLHGEEQKESEISLIPKTWNIKRLGEVATLQRGKDLPKYEFKEGNIPVIGSNGCIGYHNKAIKQGPGVITGRSGSIGKITYIEGSYWPHNTALYVKDFHDNEPLFVYYLLHRLDFNKYKTGVSVPTLNRNFIHAALLPVPPKKEQEEIANILLSIDKKISQAESKKQTLQNLFKTMLNQLMRGKIRVKDFDFEVN